MELAVCPKKCRQIIENHNLVIQSLQIRDADILDELMSGIEEREPVVEISLKDVLEESLTKDGFVRGELVL